MIGFCRLEICANRELAQIGQSYQEVFFTKIGYGRNIKNEFGSKPLGNLKEITFTLVTGIANPKPLVEFLEAEGLTFIHKSFSDHHNFSTSEIEMLEQENMLLTTEKDFMRLQPVIKKAELYYLPITTEFLEGSEQKFLDRIFAHQVKEKSV